MHENCVPREEFEARIAELEIEYQKRIQELEVRLERYEGPHAPPSTREIRYPKREPTGNKIGKPEGAPGATRKLEHLVPNDRKKIKPDKCRRCNQKLGEPYTWIRQLVQELPEPQKARLIEFMKGVCICANCGTENVATDPNCPTEGEFGPRTLALVQDLRYKERLSVSMTRAFLRERYGIDVCDATIIDMSSRTADALKTEHNLLVMRIRSAQIAHIDETGFYVNGKRIWLWVIATEKGVLFVIDKSRGSRVPKRILGTDFRGTVISDCLSTYDLLKKSLPKATFQKCWAHLLRESKKCGQLFEDGKALHEELKSFFAGMKAFLSTTHTTEERKLEYESALSWLSKFLMHEPKERKLVNLVNRLRKHGADWFTCLLFEGVEPTNNRAEQALRPQVILRRLRGSLRSDRGVEDHEILTSLMTTWEFQGLNPALQLETELSEIFAGGGYG